MANTCFNKIKIKLKNSFDKKSDLKELKKIRGELLETNFYRGDNKDTEYIKERRHNYFDYYGTHRFNKGKRVTENQVILINNSIYIELESDWTPLVNFTKNLSRLYPEISIEIKYCEPSSIYAGIRKYERGERIYKEDIFGELGPLLEFKLKHGFRDFKYIEDWYYEYDSDIIDNLRDYVP